MISRKPKIKDQSEINKLIGEAMRLQRVKAGVSQKSIADAAGVSHQQIAKYESGKNSPTVETIFKISRNLRLSDLFFFEIAAKGNVK